MYSCDSQKTNQFKFMKIFAMLIGTQVYGSTWQKH